MSVIYYLLQSFTTIEVWEQKPARTSKPVLAAFYIISKLRREEQRPR